MNKQSCSTCAVTVDKREGYCTRKFNIGRRNAMSTSHAYSYMNEITQAYQIKNKGVTGQPIVLGGPCPLYRSKS